MNVFIKSITSLIFVMFSIISYGQQGTIRGKVIDDTNGEELIGVTVLIKGTTQGATTDLEGSFFIKTSPGNYELQISYVSYKTIIIKDINVNAGEISNIGTIRLEEAVEQLSEVTVTAKALKSSESALLTVKKKSANLLDGISKETFKRMGDSDAASAIKRVSGVAIQDGQYVYVRGLGDRYTKTLLNSMEIPGLDPDRNAIQIDIFPANIIGNIMVYKTFTPDLSADFVGGTVNIETVEFPEEKTFNVSASVAYNPDMHLINNYLSYQGSSTDALGFDNGLRDLPYDARRNGNIPLPTDNLSKTGDITQKFSPTMGTSKMNNLPNLSLSLSAGNQKEYNGFTLGYNAALNYSNNYNFYANAVDAYYIKPNFSDETGLERDTDFSGPLAIHDVQLNGLFGLALKTSSSKIRLQGLHLQNGIERAAKRTRVRSNENFNTAIVDNLEYTERSLTNIMTSGEHLIGSKRDFIIEWSGSGTFSQVDDKDVRITPFTVDEDDGSLSIVPQEGGEPNRIWRLLDEQNYVGKVDFTKNFQFRGVDSKIKFGASNIYKERDFEIQDFFVDLVGPSEEQAVLNQNLNGDPNNLLKDDNIIDGDNQAGVAMQSRYAANNTYNGRINILGGYVMSELGISEKLKTILGLRVEQYDQFYTGLNTAALDGSPAGREFNDEKVLSSLNFFPSVNLIYNLIKDSNLRASYSKTIARPSFKELSTAEIQDVLTGATFIGNIDLVETTINNYDLRWEYFLSRGQMVSIGAFYKTFKNPIEYVRSPNQPTDFGPQNVGDAEIVGVEFEFRKDFAFISEAIKNFSLTTNFTWTSAQVNINNRERQGRINGLRDGEELQQTRDFLGQPPLTINAALNYINFESGLDASLSFNRQSAALAIVGINRVPDTYTVPFNSLNYRMSKSFGGANRNTIAVTIENILNDEIEREFRSFMSDSFIESRRSPGTSFQVSYSRRF